VLFDRRGNRLGRGGGWYDRVLCELGNHGIFVGLAYESQMVESLPVESWDRRVHFIITEKKQIDCGITPH
jgi:5-formyltetrahydrofolate cyclo-ligase